MRRFSRVVQPAKGTSAAKGEPLEERGMSRNPPCEVRPSVNQQRGHDHHRLPCPLARKSWGYTDLDVQTPDGVVNVVDRRLDLDDEQDPTAGVVRENVDPSVVAVVIEVSSTSTCQPQVPSCLAVRSWSAAFSASTRDSTVSPCQRTSSIRNPSSAARQDLKVGGATPLTSLRSIRETRTGKRLPRVPGLPVAMPAVDGEPDWPDRPMCEAPITSSLHHAYSLLIWQRGGSWCIACRGRTLPGALSRSV